MQREIEKLVYGKETIDGAGVKLIRVLGPQTIKEFDPILMLDCFDSTDFNDYKASFPMHPHRGIETISYVYEGSMTHKDSLGNTDTIQNGQVQWMSAGSGILHEEILHPSTRILGVQLWLNLPQKNKMSDPFYKSIKEDEIKELDLENAKMRILAGEYQGINGYKSQFLPFDYYDIHLQPNKKQIIYTKTDYFVMLFLLQGDAYINNQLIKEKTAVKLSLGEYFELKSTDKKAQILFISSIALNEPCEWGGPIVMNTKEELNLAFKELRNGTFLKTNTNY
ncbi:pirin family protein [Campylobacter sp. TTU-622]|uniref:pirin family protein n=1 Tax=Campylobacter sp. TTU-622 TaxID=2800583 RepID=UPI001906ED67|nr:pirin family protein [Campylobacter sp. TTU-622]MBK1973071.1 pirin family protein [Campylobacter sp. TTU-622]